ncbi:MAG: hypothetical protein ABI903_10545 [Actinomycetota bacterium]
MTQESPSPIGTVAQEAARLIEDMAAMARSQSPDQTSRYAGEPAEEPVRPKAQHGPAQGQHRDERDREGQPGEARHRGEQHRGEQHREGPDPQAFGPGATDQPGEGACSHCGAEPGDSRGDDVRSTCTLCPVCRGIDLLRSVRPETIDLLADLAMSVAGGLRDFALRSRGPEAGSSATSGAGGSPDPDRAPVQDIPVDDESEG